MKTKEKSITTNQIIKEIEENGGFCNINKWNEKEIAQWVKSSYNCSTYVANNVAFYLANQYNEST